MGKGPRRGYAWDGWPVFVVGEIPMSDLVNSLKNEHRAIQGLLQETRQAGITTAEGRAKLKKAKVLLLSHLEKEDQQLYPVLMNRGDAAMAGSFAEEMRAISAQVVAFFEKYEAGGDDFQFAVDFGKVLGLLNNRIRREEASLYRHYERLVAVPA